MDLEEEVTVDAQRRRIKGRNVGISGGTNDSMGLIGKALSKARYTAGFIRSSVERYSSGRLNRKVDAILRDSRPVVYIESEDEFEALQRRFKPVPEYGYDHYSCWLRGTQRAMDVFERIPTCREPGKDVLEAACGDGMTGIALSRFGHNVVLQDLEDRRLGPARDSAFAEGDICGFMPLERDRFDLICSYNSLEHVEDPGRALAGLVRLCRSGGHILLHFGPLYWSPWGLHAYRTLRMPYPQILFSDEFVRRKLAVLGISDLGGERSSLQPLNRWKPAQFRSLWRESGCRILEEKVSERREFLDLVSEFPAAFRGRGLSVEDITVQALYVVLRKE